MKKSLMFNSIAVGDLVFDFKNSSSTGGKLYPLLFLPIEITLKKLDQEYVERVPKFTIKVIKTELFMDVEPEKLSDSVNLVEATFNRTRTNSYSIKLEFPLNHHTISRIELLRGDDLKLKLKFQLQLGVFEAVNSSIDSRIVETKYFVSDYQILHEECYLEIPQSHWLKNILPNLGAGEFFIIELPADKNHSEAWNYISKAEGAFRNWDSKSIFANCRELGKLLDGEVRTKLGKDSFAYAQRWQKRFKNYNEFASLDLHLEDIRSKSSNYSLDEVKSFRADGENMILSAKILLKYAQALLNE